MYINQDRISCSPKELHFHCMDMKLSYVFPEINFVTLSLATQTDKSDPAVVVYMPCVDLSV